MTEERAVEPELIEPESAEGQADTESEKPEGETTAAASDEYETLYQEVEDLRQELESTKAKEAEYLDGWQRARAELANARKRFQREQEQSYTNAKADILFRLLPAVDDLERGSRLCPATFLA